MSHETDRFWWNGFGLSSTAKCASESRMSQKHRLRARRLDGSRVPSATNPRLPLYSLFRPEFLPSFRGLARLTRNGDARSHQ